MGIKAFQFGDKGGFMACVSALGSRQREALQSTAQKITKTHVSLSVSCISCVMVLWEKGNYLQVYNNELQEPNTC